ncbi:chondroitin AC/alginate lyase [Russula earlei]|uniref:Chondroitin AC/alginate lyase n=1 Tax=Russula earlei TaxID=71964 RepID=A0ACC0U7M1_9AGAM|nr:chondroitin AC/alginate lyase [Russula earlei]
MILSVVPLVTIVLSLFAVPSFAGLNMNYAPYANEFIEPSYILNKNWTNTTIVSQGSIIQWANSLALLGPWSVTASKTILAPSNNSHDYLSWAPYYWPNCTGVGNTTALTPQQMWVTCPYVMVDGVFNPDIGTINNAPAFETMASAVLFNTIAWVITGTPKYSTNVASWINTWFLNSSTYMNPNLNYAQMARGPGYNVRLGDHTGVLDLKCMTKIVSAVLVLRAGNAPGWTSAIDAGLVNWTTSYIGWLTTSPVALNESIAPNNHGSFYYTQLSSLQILVNDTAGASASIHKYFSTTYLNQINATGEQPFEMIRTRPYHYRSYNLCAMITNARIASHLGFSAWNLPTASGAIIKTALDFTMTVPPGNELAAELYPNVGAGAAVYGDPSGTYAKFLSTVQPNYPANPWFFYDQPFSDSGWVAVHAGGLGAETPGAALASQTAAPLSIATPTSTHAPSTDGTGAVVNSAGARILVGTNGQLFVGVAALVLLHAFIV